MKKIVAGITLLVGMEMCINGIFIKDNLMMATGIILEAIGINNLFD